MSRRWKVVFLVALVLVVASLGSSLGPIVAAVTGVLESTPFGATPILVASAIATMFAAALAVRLAHRPLHRVRVLARRGRPVGEIARSTGLSHDAVRTLIELRGKPCSTTRKDLPVERA